MHTLRARNDIAAHACSKALAVSCRAMFISPEIAVLERQLTISHKGGRTVSDDRFNRAAAVGTTEPIGSCLVVTRPQRRQAPGHDGGFDSRVRAVVMAFISDFYSPGSTQVPRQEAPSS
jgi:hypothetical protein